MKNLTKKLLSLLLIVSICVYGFPGTATCSETKTQQTVGSDFRAASLLSGKWTSRRTVTEQELYQLSSLTYFIDSGPIDRNSTEESFGASLNFKYYSGLPYSFLRKEAPGKTISVKIHIPASAVSPFSPIPNRMRITLKSETNGEWVEYYEKEWLKVKKPGTYTISFKIPEVPTVTPQGKTFHPEDLALFAIEFYVAQGGAHHSSSSFSFSDFSISGVSLDAKQAKWQFMKNGRSILDTFALSFGSGSTVVREFMHSIDLDFAGIRSSSSASGPGSLDGLFLSFPAFVPRELRQTKGAFALAMESADDATMVVVKDFSSCTLEGMVFITVPLEGITVQNNIEETLGQCSLFLRIRSDEALSSNTLPIVLLPPMIRQGRLIPFDNSWDIRDVQALGGYKTMKLSTDGQPEPNAITVSDLFLDNFSAEATIPLKGGMSQGNPLKRVELVRDLENSPLDLDNMRLEVLISPLTDTTDTWQSPYRARLGIMDINGQIMFGPNISLSEGLPSLAHADVSTTNPIPKGLMTPGFDPHKIKSVLINFEAPPQETGIEYIRVALSDLIISPKEYRRPSPVSIIDFTQVKSSPESWRIRDIIKNGGGFIVGINYPFPSIDVSPEILAVPLIYPIVGKKPSDARHFGISSSLTKETLLKDFTLFAETDIDLVRLLVLGHLEGVFTWDPTGRDIAGIFEGSEAMLQDMAGMKVETLAVFLESNETAIFGPENKLSIPGVAPYVMKDLFSLFDILESIENKTGKRLLVDLAMYDFMFADGIRAEGPYRTYSVGEHPEVATDPIVKVKALSILWKMMKVLSQDPRFYKYVGLVEVINEPANSEAITTKTYFPDLLSFVGDNLFLIKKAIGPTVPVSVGFRSWPPDLRYWSNIAAGIDILVPHYWESLESYNIDQPGLWPLDMPTSRLWESLGSKKGDRLTGMGEISPAGKLSTNLFRLEKAGYDFALVWSYSGHDGHNAKPVMPEIKNYQEGNFLSKSLMAYSPEGRKKAYTYVSQLKNSLTQKDLGSIIDKETKKILELLIQIAAFKKVDLTVENCAFLLIKAPERTNG